ncbi:MAG: iron-containing alcohol dehydrogenase, partial [Firmicutes bacterium]|nr:iron-containing alcohol dehydrogenase [Bacillota bacterium]
MAKALGKEDAKDPMDFVAALHDLQVRCGVDNLKMSDYGIKPEEFEALASNAQETMGGLFEVDPCEISHADIVAILKESYR